MAYFVDRVVICDAYREPDKHYRLLPGGLLPSDEFNLYEAHHVYGENRSKKGEDPAFIKWSKILERVSKAARVPLLVDLLATPWNGSGSPKPEGTLFEWLVADFPVYDWRRRVLDVLENAVRGVGLSGAQPVPILGEPQWLDTADLRRFQWTGVTAKGKRCHTNKVPCHTELEARFADFLDGATDVVRYFKNERFGFSVTYYENNRPRQYYPDFLIAVREADGREVMWVAETKGEIRPNTVLKSEAARLWCEKMSRSRLLRRRRGGGTRSLGRSRQRRQARPAHVRRTSRRAIHGTQNPRRRFSRVPRRTRRDTPRQNCARPVPRPRRPGNRRHLHRQALLLRESGGRRR